MISTLTPEQRRLVNWALDMDVKRTSIGTSLTKQHVSSNADREVKLLAIIHALCLRVTELNGQIVTLSRETEPAHNNGSNI